MTITASSAWAALDAHCDACATVHLRDLFERDPQRAESFSLSFDTILFDYSKQRVSAQTLGLLVDLARQAQLPAAIERMFAGERINSSEDRSVLHVALRRSSGPFPSAAFDVMPEVVATRKRMADFATCLRDGRCTGHQGCRFAMSSISASVAPTSDPR